MRRGFEWNPRKARANALKHGVRFAEAVIAVEDPCSRHLPDPDAQGEERYVALGTDATGRVLLVVYSLRGAVVRIISARRATRRERMQYEEFR